jgi:dTDP-glucose 4,6-dehydratase/UDP-glucose 4-epimerase
LKLLIIGSRGFIGSNIVENLLKTNYEVIGCDVVEYSTREYKYHKLSLEAQNFETIFNDKVDFCINAAGSGNVNYSFLYPYDDFYANTIAVAKVLEAIKKNQPNCKYIHISSAAVYGNPYSLPINEYFEIKPLSPYGYHKWMSEIICREYFQLYNIPIAILRPFSVYGNGLKKQLLWDLCQKMKENSSVTLFGTGNETRDFIHILDLVDAIIAIIKSGSFHCDVYNIANNKEISIAEVAHFFEKNFPGKNKILFNGETKQGDPVNWCADISKLKNLGFEPKIKFENGAIEYINWFLKQ